MCNRETIPKRFHDRQDAGRELARELLQLTGTPGRVVLGLPRGGVPVAAEISRRLECPLDVVMVRKVGAPGFPELAMGAVASIGGSLSTIRNERVIAGLVNDRSASTGAIFEEAAAQERAEVARREELYRAGKPPLDVAGRTVVVVDDGVATGATLRAAIVAVRRLHPARLMVAAPVFLGHSLASIREVADRVFCLWEAPVLGSVGHAYRHFEPVPDDEVQRILDAGSGDQA